MNIIAAKSTTFVIVVRYYSDRLGSNDGWVTARIYIERKGERGKNSCYEATRPHNGALPIDLKCRAVQAALYGFAEKEGMFLFLDESKIADENGRKATIAIERTN